MVRQTEAVIDPLGRCDSVNAGVILGKSQSTLANWRALGIGPKWFKVNGRVYYNFDELEAFGRGEVNAAA